MRTFLYLLPPALSSLTLGAHFLRRGELLPTALCVVLFGVLFTRRRWAPRVVQAAMALAMLIWVRTIVALIPVRRAAGEPWQRMAVILGAVAFVALIGALVFESPTLRRRFGRNGSDPRA